MLLTVIAVATLLVAVVGATFAYFSVSATSSMTADIKASTEKVGTVTLSIGEKPHLNINAEDMSIKASEESDKTYYSTILSGDKDGDHREQAEEDTLITATLKGGSNDVKYKCTATVTVSVKESGSTSTIDFKSGDAKLKLSGDSGITANGGDLFTEIDLSTLVTSNYTKSDTVTFEFTGNGDSVVKNIKGYLSITNKKKDGDDSQNADQTERLAGKEFTVEVKADDFTCDTVGEEA